MKHVREELPDVQHRRARGLLARSPRSSTARRPRSSTTATRRRRADRATSRRRWRSRRPARARRPARRPRSCARSRRRPAGGCPLRLRTRARMLAWSRSSPRRSRSSLVLAADRTERGTGTPTAQQARAAAGPRRSRSSRARAKDYDPAGDDGEHADEARARASTTTPVDRGRPSSTRAAACGKKGVGIYVDAEPGVAARVMEILTPTPGFAGAVYGAERRHARRRSTTGTRLDRRPSETSRERERIRLDTAGKRFRYYLLWITAAAAEGERRSRSPRSALPLSRADALRSGSARCALEALGGRAARGGRRARGTARRWPPRASP